MTAVSPHPHSIPTRDRERWLWWCTEVKHPLGLIGNLGRERALGRITKNQLNFDSFWPIPHPNGRLTFSIFSLVHFWSLKRELEIQNLGIPRCPGAGQITRMVQACAALPSLCLTFRISLVPLGLYTVPWVSSCTLKVRGPKPSGKSDLSRSSQASGEEHVQLAEVSKRISLSIGLMNGTQICPKTWPLGWGSRFVGPSPVAAQPTPA